jgi:hypothetical protein
MDIQSMDFADIFVDGIVQAGRTNPAGLDRWAHRIEAGGRRYSDVRSTEGMSATMVHRLYLRPLGCSP